MSVQKIIDKFLSEIDCEHLSMLKQLNQGKHLRSRLLKSIAFEDEKVLKTCACIELIHAASLLHDDVIDECSTRRGGPSINASFGAKNAIMLGDLMYSKAYHELNKIDNFITSVISKAVIKLSVGELEDVYLAKSLNTDAQKYLRMIYHKTASLIEATAQVGAYFANYDLPSFMKYGKNLGIAFQIIDDLLDAFGDEKTLGKPVMNDLLEGKCTLVYIYLYKSQNKEEQEKLKKLFRKKLDGFEIEWLSKQFVKYGVKEAVYNEARTYAKDALEQIKEFGLPQLEDFAKSMIDRKF